MYFSIEEILKQRILVLDGGMGTLIQSHRLTENDFRGTHYQLHKKVISGCNDALNITQPHIISQIHHEYLNAGADIIETNTFNANALSLSDYDIVNDVYEINFKGAQLAKHAATLFTSKDTDKPRFVAGSVGPTSKTLSISPDISRPHYRSITFDTLMDAYFEQIIALVDGGVDIILIETVFDTLNAKAALYATQKVFGLKKTILPVMLSLTLTDKAGRNLSGQTLEAFNTTFEHIPLLSIGLNCSFGAGEMKPYIDEFSRISPFNLCVYPNAGLPNALGSYDETPEEMAALIEGFCKNNKINIIGGCCGTKPRHIELFSELVKKYKPRVPPLKQNEMKLCGLESIVVNSNLNFVNIGERTNVTGSVKFAEAIREGNFSLSVDIARKQIEDGAQIIDICMDDAMLDIKQSMTDYLNYLSAEPDIAKVPFMIDSSNWDVILAALKCVQGKAIVNSISLKDGEESFIAKAYEIKQIGAAVVVMCFDEHGQADTYERKIEIANRSYNILVQKVNFSPYDIIIDPNILAIGTGIEQHNYFASDFIKAVSWIKNNLPFVSISGGISNLSFSFRSHTMFRKALHSVFLYHCYNAGMNMGIVNPAQLMPYNQIPSDLLMLCEDLIFYRNAQAVDNIIKYLQTAKDESPAKKIIKEVAQSIDPVERLKQALIHGVESGIEENVKEAIEQHFEPVSIIEGPLMDAMNYVGRLFGEGKMFLPQVVKTARVMKLTVNALMPFVNKSQQLVSAKRGKVLIATVKGDVHDIGKNIVATVLSCNNLEIIDLGVMVPAEIIVESAIKNKVDIIALSGLITPSLHEMMYVAKKLQDNHLKIPLLIGGAATSAVFTAIKIAPCYDGGVFYVKDASMAVSIASEILSANKEAVFEARKIEIEQIKENYEKRHECDTFVPLHEARINAAKQKLYDRKISVPDFTGTKVIKEFEPEKILPYMCWKSFLSAWDVGSRSQQNPTLKDEVAQNLLVDAKELLNSLLKENSIKSEIVLAIFKANAYGDDIAVDIEGVKHKLFMLRKQSSADVTSCISLSDFVVPYTEGIDDYIGLFVISSYIQESSSANNDNEYENTIKSILTDRWTEAVSEWLFTDTLQRHFKISENHSKRAIRPAVGYSCYPDHSEKQNIFQILDAHKHLKVRLTSNFAMNPVSSVCGIYIVNEKAKYFNVGKIGEDQLSNYAKRKGVVSDNLNKFLSSNII